MEPIRPALTTVPPEEATGTPAGSPSRQKTHPTQTARRRLGTLLSAGLLILGLAAVASAPAAHAATCPDPTNVDCPPAPSDTQFVQLTNDTLTYLPPIPVRAELIRLVQRAQDALHPPSPIHPPVPVRSYNLLGAYLNQVQALAGTPSGATDSGTVILLIEASGLRAQIAAAYPDIHFPPAPIEPGV